MCHKSRDELHKNNLRGAYDSGGLTCAATVTIPETSIQPKHRLPHLFEFVHLQGTGASPTRKLRLYVSLFLSLRKIKSCNKIDSTKKGYNPLEGVEASY